MKRARFLPSILLTAIALAALASCAPRSTPFSPSLVGTWQGSIAVQGRTLPITVHFDRSGKAVMDIVSVGTGAAEAGKLSFAMQHLSVSSTGIAFDITPGSDVASFRGTISGARISGRFEQAGHGGTFTLTKSGQGAESAPSDGGIDVVLKTRSGDLHGSLLLPKTPPPYPVVLLIAASGAMDRNGNVADVGAANDSLLLYATALTERGFATLRYDKRGVGASSAALAPGRHLLFGDLIADAAEWVANLKQDPRFRGVAVAGYGEGALVGMVAAREASADAFVSIAGPGDSADALLKQQLASQPAAIRDQAFRIIDQLKAGKEVSGVGTSLEMLFGRAEQPFLISKFQYNPRTEIAKLAVPVLIVVGTNDLQTDAQEAEALHAAKPGSYLDLISGMNHVLRRVSSNPQENLASYSNPDLPIDPELVQVTGEFLRMALHVPPP